MSAPELVPMTEAARRLGVSVDTVKRRLKRGDLTGEQLPTPQGFTWLIAMPIGSGSADTPPNQTHDAERPTDDGTATAELWRLLEEERAEVVAAKDAMITRLVDEVAYLRERFDQRGLELEQRSRELAAERERADVIQQLALQRIEALTATVSEQREDPPTVAPEAPGTTDGEREGDPSSWLASVWRKVIGSS